jgi:hypothetical protein
MELVWPERNTEERIQSYVKVADVFMGLDH